MDEDAVQRVREITILNIRPGTMNPSIFQMKKRGFRGLERTQLGPKVALKLRGFSGNPC